MGSGEYAEAGLGIEASEDWAYPLGAMILSEQQHLTAIRPEHDIPRRQAPQGQSKPPFENKSSLSGTSGAASAGLRGKGEL